MSKAKFSSEILLKEIPGTVVVHSIRNNICSSSMSKICSSSSFSSRSSKGNLLDTKIRLCQMYAVLYRRNAVKVDIPHVIRGWHLPLI